MSERTYIVTLHDRRDLQNFYDEMEFPGSGGYTPTRSVKCRVRRNISRNTHYNLTDEEAARLRLDPRVLAVELPPEDRGIVATPYGSYTRTGTFSKSSSGNAAYLNWGHLHSAGTAIQRRKGTFGSDNTTTISDSVDVWSDGENVDIVIVDEGIIPGHPEWNSNVDGVSGYDRFVQYQWFNELNTYVNSIDNDLQTEPTGTIPYTDAGYHGMHCAGTAAGSLRGWATKANIYNLNIFPVDSNIDIPNLLIFDYLRAFHLHKADNPITGKKNPTITNHSWGYSLNGIVFDENSGTYDISTIVYRGTSYTSASPGPSGWTGAGINQDFGIDVFGGIATIPVRVASVDADIQDAIDDGIVIIAAAGNEYTYCDLTTGQDYNNRITYDYYNDTRTQLIGTYTDFYHRGSSPGAAPNVLCVGSLGADDNFYKSNFSNYGPRIDLFAPGSNIISAFDDASFVAGGDSAQNINDARDANFDLGVISGTSMASPQVAGIAACYASGKDRVGPGDIRSYILGNTITGEMDSNASGGGYLDYTSLNNTKNEVVAAVNERRTSGLLSDFDILSGERPLSGQSFPRVKTFKQVDCSNYVFHATNPPFVEGFNIVGRDDINYYGGQSTSFLTLTGGRSFSFLYEEANAIDMYYYHANTTSATAYPSVLGSSQSYGSLLELNPLLTSGQLIIKSNAGETSITVGDSQHFPWTVTNSGSSAYILEGYDRIQNITGSPGTNWLVNVQAGDIVSFDVNASGHPFYIKTVPTTGTGDQVTTGDVQGQGSAVGIVSWNTIGVAPGTYYYICQYHSGMQGSIIVT